MLCSHALHVLHVCAHGKASDKPCLSWNQQCICFVPGMPSQTGANQIRALCVPTYCNDYMTINTEIDSLDGDSHGCRHYQLY
jgi:hypothetical protein